MPAQRFIERDGVPRRGRRGRLLALIVAVLAGLAVALLFSRGGPAGRSAASRASTPSPGGRRTSATAPSMTRAGRITQPHPGRAHVVVSGSPASSEVALTFDDGFCAFCVHRIVDVLWRTGAHATLFPNGVYASKWAPEAPRIRAMIARGQIVVGNHTYLHRDPVTESGGAFTRELDANESWIERTFGVSARPWFRPPYGAYDAQTMALSGTRGLTRVILWSGTLADSTPQTIPYLRKAVRDWGRRGAIILAHANYPNTARDLPNLIRMLQSRGLRLVTIAELPGASSGLEGKPTNASPAIPAR